MGLFIDRGENQGIIYRVLRPVEFRVVLRRFYERPNGRLVAELLTEALPEDVVVLRDELLNRDDSLTQREPRRWSPD